MYRQGDVLIFETDRKPEGVEIPKDNGRAVLAYGEVTGHAHAIRGNVRMFRPDDMPVGNCVLVVEDGRVELRHEEHDTISLRAGTYEVRRQREWDAGEARRVAD